MEDLSQARELIDRADRELAAAFKRRMEASVMVAAYKREHGLPILDAEREKAVLEKHTLYMDDPTLQPYFTDLLKHCMALSRAWQHKLGEGFTVAYSGVEGAFAAIAAERIFPEAHYLPCASFEEAYRKVESGEADCCVLPIENSYAGEVGQVNDLMFSGPLFVSGVYDMPIHQHLIGVPGAQVSEVKKVISHPQALSQCADYIAAHGMEAIQASNTARAARTVAEMADPSMAAIASAETAGLYGLSILASNINASSANTTRFAVFTRIKRESTAADRRFILLFTVRNEAGSLAKAVDIIGRYGYNLRVLRSRPQKKQPWQYYFYAEAEGNAESETGRAMLKELGACCDMLKVAGQFENEITLEEK
ncbi:MAG: chorismate mutase [Clostridia bacterium]|nr:chorismate mutase [Clostridia bacterium]